MTTPEAFSLVGSLFSVALAVFAIWMAFQQRKESQDNYDNTKELLSEVKAVSGKTELLVSENFQNLLKSMTEQQATMMESLRPKKTSDELIFEIAKDDPEKLKAMVAAVVDVSTAQADAQIRAAQAQMQLQQAMGNQGQ